MDGIAAVAGGFVLDCYVAAVAATVVVVIVVVAVILFCWWCDFGNLTDH